MSLVRKVASTAKASPEAFQAVAAGIPRNVSRGADVQRNRAHTLAKQQQASELVAAATDRFTDGFSASLDRFVELFESDDATRVAFTRRKSLVRTHPYKELRRGRLTAETTSCQVSVPQPLPPERITKAV